MIIKILICKIVMEVLYRAVRVLAKHDYRIMKELCGIEHSSVVSLSVSPLPGSPRLTFKVQNGTIKKTKTSSCDIEIIFKSTAAAFLVFTGRMSVAEAYAAHAFYLFGSVNAAMAVVRVVNITECCLFPKFITKRIMTKVHKRNFPMLSTYILLPFNF